MEEYNRYILAIKILLVTGLSKKGSRLDFGLGVGLNSFHLKLNQ